MGRTKGFTMTAKKKRPGGAQSVPNKKKTKVHPKNKLAQWFLNELDDIMKEYSEYFVDFSKERLIKRMMRLQNWRVQLTEEYYSHGPDIGIIEELQKRYNIKC